MAEKRKATCLGSYNVLLSGQPGFSFPPVHPSRRSQTTTFPESPPLSRLSRVRVRYRPGRIPFPLRAVAEVELLQGVEGKLRMEKDVASPFLTTSPTTKERDPD